MEERKFQFSWSHLLLAIIGLAYLVIVGFAISIIVHCFSIELYEYGVQVLLGLFTFTGAISGIGISFYEWKAKNENQAKVNNSRNEKRLNLAMKICEYLKDGKIDTQSVIILKDIISDGQTSVSVNGYNGTVTTVDEIQYGVGFDDSNSYSNPYEVDDILDEVDMNRITGGMG